MQYQYTQDQNWEDYSAGRVLHNFPGHPAFPVRLASELFQQAYAVWQTAGGVGRCRLFDPCCGGAYHLAVLGLLHSDAIGEIIAADVDSRALELAQLNLRLLSIEGLAARTAEIAQMAGDYGKASHQEALESAHRIRAARQAVVPVTLFQADALANSASHDPDLLMADIVFSDVPYGIRSAWIGGTEVHSPLERFLENLVPILTPRSVVIIAADKAQKIQHGAYQRLKRWSIGKRQAMLLRIQ
ncbi:MAG: hypothetical protein HPY85_10875 [Anaerolineae bacterium]|nr:hypothetical protein [Anaerolineae bacterium]